MRKLLALAFVLFLALSILLIERDFELWQENARVYNWGVFFARWHNVDAFGPDGRWNVERSFDHNAHWKWQMEEMQRIRQREREEDLYAAEEPSATPSN